MFRAILLTSLFPDKVYDRAHIATYDGLRLPNIMVYKKLVCRGDGRCSQVPKVHEPSPFDPAGEILPSNLISLLNIIELGGR